MHLKNNVNHKNMLVIWHYLRDFAKKNNLVERDINIFEKLNLPYPDEYQNALDYYTDRTQWSPHDTFVSCYLKAKEIIAEPDFYRRCGRTAVRLNSISNWKNIAIAFSGPGAVYNNTPKAFSDWNDTKTAAIIDPARYLVSARKVKVVIKYKIHDHIAPESDYCSDPHIRGILEAIPTYWPKRLWQPWKKLPMATVNQPMVQYDPVKLFNSVFFEDYHLDPRVDGDQLSIRDPSTHNRIEIGRRVYLKKTRINHAEEYIGDYRETGSGRTGFLITRSVDINGDPICEKGTIYQGPHFVLEVLSDELPITRRIINVKNYSKINNMVLNEISHNVDRLRTEMGQKEAAYDKLDQYKNNLEKMIYEKEIELKATQQKIMEKEKKMIENQITGGFAHEVRNALAGIQIELESLGGYKGSGKRADTIATEKINHIKQIIQKLNPDDDDQEKIEETLQTLDNIVDDATSTLISTYHAVQKIMGITEQIRRYAKSLELTPGQDIINIADIVTASLKKRSAQLKKLNISYTIDGDTAIEVPADKMHIDSIVDNLILNAIESIQEQKRPDNFIHIRLYKDQTHVIVEITDSGMGIDPKDREHLFDPFFTTKTEGSGLGLSMARRLTNLYNGDIYAHADSGTGATFTIRLGI